MSNLTQLTDATFNQTIEQQPGIKVVIFTAPSCITCHQHTSYLESHQGDIHAPLYEVNGANCPNVIKQLGITRAPQLGVFRPSGSYISIDTQQPTLSMVGSINRTIRQFEMEMEEKTQ